MIVISGTFTIGADSRAQATAAATAMAQETRKEAGCLAYAFSSDLEDVNVIHLFEAWESAKVLSAHFGTQHMREFRAKLATLNILSRRVQRYEVSSVEDM